MRALPPLTVGSPKCLHLPLLTDPSFHQEPEDVRRVVSHSHCGQHFCWLCCNSFSENLCHPGSNLGTALPPALKESSFMLHRMALLSARNAGKIIS